ncbi:uncharacterized protein LOC115374190 isoform X2 [Myripristis murdjan]|uniref:uncharacterized protein LOC115374190 isoform X2 n=1 Tax=Myripristis murdjan TaxID=586833 RepID=UPI0011762AD2|nr:uncharacterized protein LOC115374190 isoform X2 [Myripristis murdjan]
MEGSACSWDLCQGAEMSQVRRSVGEALWGMCAADAMSMPVHWYYNIPDIKRDFGGWITNYSAPRSRHPSSILTLSNPAGSGRTSWSSGARRPDVVGDIILHDKLKFWKSASGSVHYHQGMRAGDNTLNVRCALRVALTLLAGGFSDVSQADARGAVLADYVSFLTTAGSHNDTYAESWHRAFFSDWAESRPASPAQLLEFAERRADRKLSSPPDGQLDAIGCLPMILPFILLSTSANEERAVSAALQFVRLTHPHPRAAECVRVYGRALHATLGGADLRQQAELALRSLAAWDTCQRYSRRAARFPASSEERLQVHQDAVDELGLACYSRGALSSLFYLAYEFHDDPRGGILTNTNCGGENCNRGAALGALLGARAAHGGSSVPQEWKEALTDAQEVVPDILQQLA